METAKLMKVAELFPGGKAETITPLSGGHINRTFIAVKNGVPFVLQSLNSSIFSAEAVMSNIAQVEKAFTGSEGIRIPRYLPCGDRNFAEYGGEIWRMYQYAGGEPAADPYRTGLAFGEFMRIVNSRKLKLETALPGFHDIGGYFRKFTAAAAAVPSRKPDSAVTVQLGRLLETLEQVFTPDIPKRAIHGDAKSANIVIAETPTVLDLDTVMTGYAALDLGDMVRSAMKNGQPDMAAVSGIARGFAKGTAGLLSRAEVDSLYYGILWVTGELAMRYLTDYISGEGYFHRPAQECLARANQLLGQLRGFISSGDQITGLISEAFR